MEIRGSKGGRVSSSLNESAAKRIARLLCLFGSSFENEAVNALLAMRRLVAAEGLNFADIAILIENHEGEIEAKKYSDVDAELIFRRGLEKGVEKARKECAGRILSADYFDDDGEPRWLEITNYCQNNPAKSALKPNEQQFIDELPVKLRWRDPTPPMGGFLLSIFWKLRRSLK
jgi:hypothetical protein